MNEIIDSILGKVDKKPIACVCSFLHAGSGVTQAVNEHAQKENAESFIIMGNSVLHINDIVGFKSFEGKKETFVDGPLTQAVKSANKNGKAYLIYESFGHNKEVDDYMRKLIKSGGNIDDKKQLVVVLKSDPQDFKKDPMCDFIVYEK